MGIFMKSIDEIEKEINVVLEKVRPYLQVDNGDIEFVRYEPDTQVAEVRFLGMCHDCAMSIMTLRAGIERFILKDVPEVRRIEMVK